MGVRYADALIETLLQGVLAMEESVTYQKILRKGEAAGLRKALLAVGRNRFGEPSAEAVAALEALTDVEKLQELTLRLLQAGSWQELLGPHG